MVWGTVLLIPQCWKLLGQAKQPFLDTQSIPSVPSLSTLSCSSLGEGLGQTDFAKLRKAPVSRCHVAPFSVPGKPSVTGVPCSWERYSGLSLSELKALLDQGHWAHSGFGRRGLRRVMGGQSDLGFFFRCQGYYQRQPQQPFSRVLDRSWYFPFVSSQWLSGEQYEDAGIRQDWLNCVVLGKLCRVWP